MSQKEQSQSKLDQVVADARKYQDERAKGYRERALKMYPWICGRCTREFVPSNLRELTVHHRDHDHDNNPADGTNWELLCVYCHDNEHQRHEEFVRYGGEPPIAGEKKDDGGSHNPFANLKDMLGKKD